MRRNLFEAPRAATRRLVDTSNGTLVLEITNFGGHLSVTANAFDEHGWEVRSRRVGWSEPGSYLRTGDYEARGGRETLAEAIADAAGIALDEAARVATDTLLTWEKQIGPTELSEAHEARRALRVFVVAVALFLVAFVALLVFVLVMLVL